MKLLFFSEARLTETSEAKYYGVDQSFSYRIFERYLKVFDSVMVVARSIIVAHPAVDEDTRVDFNGVSVLPLPYYIGPYQYLIKRYKLLKTIGYYINSHPDAAIICRVPGAIGTAVANELSKKNRLYGVEVVGDPRDVFASGSFQHPFRLFFQYSGVKNMKKVVANASAALYVTKKSLQVFYPTASNIFSTYASDVVLKPDAFVTRAKNLKHFPPYSIVVIGSLAALYKSPDIVIEVMSIFKRKGLNIFLKWIGDGRYRPKMIDLATKRGVIDRMAFVGNVRTAIEVRKYLDEANLFLLPSRTEGLPRALLEAMARGLPCIATEVGGIPELLDKEVLVPINNAEVLAEKIEKLLMTPGIADAQAKRNLSEAENYAFEILEARVNKFHRYLKEISVVNTVPPSY